MRFYGNNRQLEYDIIVKPGANPSRVQLSYQGIEGLKVTEEGDLEIALKGGKLIQKRPYVYQEIEGKRVERKGEFKVSRLESKVQNTKHEARNSKHFIYAFQVASYDKRYPLVIDPILEYSTYLGGSGRDLGRGIAVDTAGNAYITGSTYSFDFPTANALDKKGNKEGDVFITKMNAAGTNLIFSTYFGGGSDYYSYEGDSVSGIAVDTVGNVYITGGTGLYDFPIVNAFDTSLNGGDAFVTKILFVTKTPSDLQARYTCNEDRGTMVTDSSGNGNNGTIEGATWTTGREEGGLSFDGIDDSVSIPLINNEELSVDEGTGTIAHDASGNDNHGEIQGAVWTAGKSGNGLSFDGVNDSVSVPRMNHDEISLSAWFRKNANDTSRADAIFSGLTRLSQFASKKGYFWAQIIIKPLILQGSNFKMACSADLPY